MRRVTEKLRSTGRAGLLLMIAVLALAIGRFVEHAYVAAVAVTAALVIGLAWPWLAMRLVSASVRCSVRQCRVGETIELNVIGRNRGWLPIPDIAVDARAAGGLRSDVPPMAVGYGETAWPLTVTADRRGVIELARLRIKTGFPFALWHATRGVRSAERLIVWPTAASVDASLLVGQGQVMSMERVNASVNADGELAGVRAYRRGDSVRSIHWQQTARHDRLIVRERAGGERQHCTAILDTRRAVYSDEAAFERAVSFLAGIVEQCAVDGRSLTMILNDVRSETSDDAGRKRAMDALAAITRAEHGVSPIAARSKARGILVTTSIGWASAGAAGLVPLLVDSPVVAVAAGSES